jgi:thiamine-monophosphate kinase
VANRRARRRAGSHGSSSAERDFVERLARQFVSDDPRVHVGIGDDGAVLRTSMLTVAVCDPVVEGVHFTREDPLHLVGRKVVNRNLSDLAAMGAKPGFLLVSMLLPDWLDESGRSKILTGIQSAAEAAACSVVGGDVARVSGPLVLTVTALGEAPKRPLRRNGLTVGDTLHVTGPLGGSRLGRHLRFTPRIAEGRWLAEQDAASVAGAIDISDGLLVDLSRMLEASSARHEFELGAVLYSHHIPVAAAARRAATESRRGPLTHALEDGEDHELLFGLHHPLPDDGPLTGRARKEIGRVTDEPGIFLEDKFGNRRGLHVVGYQHDV